MKTLIPNTGRIALAMAQAFAAFRTDAAGANAHIAQIKLNQTLAFLTSQVSRSPVPHNHHTGAARFRREARKLQNVRARASKR